MNRPVNAIRRFGRNLVTRAATMLGMPFEQFAAISGRSIGASISGVTVTSDSALKVSSYKRGVELIADYVAKTPFHVKRNKRKDKTHPAWRLVRKWAQYHQLSAFHFRKTMTVLAITRGNSYAYIVRDSVTFEPLELRILDPSQVTPVLKAGVLTYRFRSSPQIISATDVIHIKALSTDGYVGLDPIRTYAVDVLGLSLAQSQYAGTYYAAGGSPSVYLYSPVPLDDDKFNRLKGETGPLKRSLYNPHDIPVLDMAELRTLNLDAQATQLLGSREFALKDIANLLNLTVHKLNGDGTGGYSSVEEENNAFRDDTLDPYFCQYEIEYEKLLTEREQAEETVSIEAVRESLTRSNMNDRANYLQKAVGGPWMTAAEGRDVDSLEELDNTDQLYPPPNMTKPDPNTPQASPKASAPNTPPTVGKKRKRRLSDVKRSAAADTLKQITAVEDTFSRLLKRIATQARKAGERSQTFPEFLSGLEAKHGEVIRSALSPIVELCGGSSEHIERCEKSLIAETRLCLQLAYDAATPDKFAGEVNTVCDRLERSAGHYARKAVESWNN